MGATPLAAPKPKPVVEAADAADEVAAAVPKPPNVAVVAGAAAEAAPNPPKAGADVAAGVAAGAPNPPKPPAGAAVDAAGASLPSTSLPKPKPMPTVPGELAGACCAEENPNNISPAMEEVQEFKEPKHPHLKVPGAIKCPCPGSMPPSDGPKGHSDIVKQGLMMPGKA